MPIIASPNQSGINYDTSALANAINAPDWDDQVFDQSGGYNVYTTFIDRMMRLKGYKTRQVTSRIGQFTRYVQGLRVFSAQIASTPVASGNNLVLTWTQPSYAL